MCLNDMCHQIICIQNGHVSKIKQCHLVAHLVEYATCTNTCG